MFGLVVGGALLIQIVLQGFTARNTGASAGALVEMSTPSPPAEGNKQDDAPMVCGLSMIGDGQFESFKTEWTTLHLSTTDRKKAYLEFDVNKIALTMEFGVAAIFASGTQAHYQATTSLGYNNFVWLFKRSADMKGVDLRLHDMGMRSNTDVNTDDDYDELFKKSTLPGLRSKLAQVGSRTQGTAGMCQESSIVVDATDLFENGFYALADGVSKGTTALIERSTVKTFTNNIDVTVSYSFLGTQFPGAEEEIRFCMYLLPSVKMIGRPGDDRAGYFYREFTQVGDFKDEAWDDYRVEDRLNPTVRLINKHRWPNRYTNKNEIHYYVDPTVPKPMWEATKQGIELWNAAFDAIASGFSATDPPKIIGHKPDDADWPADYDAADLKFNTISWASSTSRVFAIGQSVKDPRTGEVLKGNIMFTLGRLEGYVAGTQIFKGLQLHTKQTQDNLEDRLDNDGAEDWTDPTAQLWHMMTSPSPEQSLEFMTNGIRQVTGHEVGHTLGLRHNFRGSMSISFDDAQNKTHADLHGLSASIMDYPHVNIISKQTKDEMKARWAAAGGTENPHDAYLHSPVIGSYDKWVIKYGYSKLAYEDSSCMGKNWCPKQQQLADIASEYDEADFTFATDGTADDFDPETVRRDLTSEPIRFFVEQFEVVKEGWEALFERSVQGSIAWSSMYKNSLNLMWHSEISCKRLNRFIGGIKTSRKHGLGCVNITMPADCLKDGLTPVDKADQDYVLEKVLGYLSGSDKRHKPPAWFQKEATEQKFLYDIEPIYVEKGINRRKMRVLTELLDPERLVRVRVSEAMMSESNRVQGWLLAEITKALFLIDGEDTDPAHVLMMLQDDYHQYLNDVQMHYLTTLQSLLVNPVLTDQSVRGSIAGELMRVHSVLKKIDPATANTFGMGMLSNVLGASMYR